MSLIAKEISPVAIKACRSNTALHIDLMTLFGGKSQKTVERYINAGHILLTTKKALNLITKHTGLTEAEILISEPAL